MEKLSSLALLAVLLSLVMACRAATGIPMDTGMASRAAASSVAAPPQFPPESFMAKLQRRGKIIIGVKFDTPPMGRLNPVTSKAEGFDIDIGKKIAKAIFGDESKAEFIEAVSANRTPFLKEDKVDLIISTMTITEERKREIGFSKVYYKAGQSILIPKGSVIRSVADLNGKRVCAAQGSTSERNVREKAPQTELVLFSSHSESLAALQTGRVDAISTDDTILGGKVGQDRNTQLVGGTFTDEPYGSGIKKAGRNLWSLSTNSSMT